LAKTTITERLDRVVEGRRLLAHPFYRAWQAGALTRDDLSFYAQQYWHHVDAFPGYLAVLAGRLSEGEAKEIVLDNHSDEVDQDHRGMWLRFAEAVGASEPIVIENASHFLQEDAGEEIGTHIARWLASVRATA
jgi:pyrroloquinoline-quinone synthase